MTTAVLDRQQQDTNTFDNARGAGRRQATAVAVAVAGALLMAVAAAIGATTIARSQRTDAPPAPAAAATFPDVGAVEHIYEPGHSSGWHVHPGVHSVVVVSGRLTVYDAVCGRLEVGPGETYLGGREAHVARNEGTEPVQLVATYVFAMASPLDHATVVPAPEACPAR